MNSKNAKKSDIHGALAALANENAVLKKFIANKDADLISEATRGFGTDEDILVEVLCNRTKLQLNLTSDICVEKFGKTLCEIVESEIGGSFGKLVSYAVMDNDDFGATVFDEAVKGTGTNAEAIIDLVNTKTNTELAAIKVKWEAKKGASLTDCLRSEFGMFNKNLREVLIHQFLGEKSERTEVDKDLAIDQAKCLYRAGTGRLGTDEQVFVNILSTQSRSQIQAIKVEYEKLYRTSLNSAIEGELSGDLVYALLSTLQSNVASYEAMALKKALRGIGTDFDRLSRLLGGTDKSLMKSVTGEYLSSYGISLQEAIKNETFITGDFKKAMLSWCEGLDPTQGLEYAGLNINDSSKLLEFALAERTSLWSYIAREDALSLNKACKGLGTDDQALINIICSRTKEHLSRVTFQYHVLFGKSFIEEIAEESSGHYRDLLINIVKSYDEYDADVIYKACKNLGTNEQDIIECLATRSNDRIIAMKAKFNKKFGTPLIDTLNSELSGCFKTIAIKLLKAQRNESNDVDSALVSKHVEKLHKAGVAAWGTDESIFIDVFASNSRAHIEAVKLEYETVYAHSIKSAIERETSGNLKNILIAQLYAPHEYFAMRLKKSCEGFGTNEDALVRILGGHDKDEMKLISEYYLSAFGTTLSKELESEIYGDFKQAAIAWIEAQSPF